MTHDEFAALTTEIFAPYVQALKLQPLDLEAEPVRLTLPENADLIRQGGTGGGVICGQALAAVADTASVYALAAKNSGFRPSTTTDLQIRFMRPLMQGDVEVRIHTLSNGRRMAVTSVEFRAKDSEKLAAIASCAFVYLDS